MPTVKLTDKICNDATVAQGEKQSEWRDTEVRNLALRVSASGKLWAWRYRWRSSRPRLMLGPYGPNDGQLSLKEARNEARQLAAKLARGENPGKAHQIAKEKRTVTDTNTVAVAITRYIERLEARGARPNYLRDMRERFNLHVLPAIGEIPVREVEALDIKRILSPLAQRKQNPTHNRVLVMLRPVFKAEKVDPNPCDDFEKRKENPREPGIFSPQQAAMVWRALATKEAGCGEATMLAIRLAMITLKRGQEVVGARVSEFDLERGLWKIPGDRMKNRRADIVPLPIQALRLVAEAIKSPARTRPARASDALFFYTDEETPIQRSALSHAFVNAKRAAGLSEHTGTLHSLRHSGATYLQGQGVWIEVLSAALSHSIESAGAARTTSTYGRNKYEDQRRDALQIWSDAIECTLQGD